MKKINKPKNMKIDFDECSEHFLVRPHEKFNGSKNVKNIF